MKSPLKHTILKNAETTNKNLDKLVHLTTDVTHPCWEKLLFKVKVELLSNKWEDKV